MQNIAEFRAFLCDEEFKLVTASRDLRKTERKDRGTDSESPFSALPQPRAAGS